MDQEKQTPAKIPLSFVLLDILGTLFLALGLYDLLVKGNALLPLALRFEYYEVTLIMIGALLMLPMIMILLELIRSNYSSDSGSPGSG